MTTIAHAYAISHWPDTDELLAKAKRLVGAPPRPIRRDRMEKYLQYFETKCRGLPFKRLTSLDNCIDAHIYLRPMNGGSRRRCRP